MEDYEEFVAQNKINTLIDNNSDKDFCTAYIEMLSLPTQKVSICRTNRITAQEVFHESVTRANVRSLFGFYLGGARD